MARILSGARCAAVMLLVMMLTMTAQTAWADTWPEYITDIILVGGTESEASAAMNAHSDYTFISRDLNDNAGGDYINFGYKKSRTANTNGGYITDIIVIDAESTNPPSTVTYDGRTYYLCSYDGGSHFESVKGNLNSNCGSGWNIYLYYTKQEYSSTKRAVSSIDVNSTKAGSINCYYKNGNKEEEQIDLNRGISGSSDVYMHLSTATKVNRPYPEPSMASNLVYDGQPKQLISSSYSNSNSGTLYYRVSTTGSYTSTVANVTATTAGTHTVYYYSASSSYGNSSESYAHSKTVTIAKAPNSGVTVSCADILEGSNVPDPQLGGTNLSNGAVSYTYSTTQNGSYSSTVPTEPGTYYVKATVAGDDNYNEFTTVAASFKIIRDWALHSTGDSEADAYVISTTDELDLLAQRVNNGTDYKDKFFKLDADITYSHTTDWNDVTSTENNFTRIGDADNTFKGTFDGQRYTIKGIRYTSSNNNLGLFGKITGGATVKNVILSDARIIGKDNCGGIAGKCEQSTITNCWVKSNVCIGNKDYKGGIAGRVLESTISGCRSEATLTAYSSSNIYYGGIAGDAESSAVSHCVVVGATIPNAGFRGAIVGRNDQSTLTSNYYTACTVVGVANAANVGCQGGDAAGARQAVAIGAATGVTVTPVGTETNYNLSGITAYEGNNGIIYGGQLYAGAGETVTFNIEYTAPEYFALNGFTDGNGNALTDNGDGTYTLTMTGAAATITPDLIDLWGITAGRDGSTAAKAYRITTPAGLDLLASKVNINTDNQYEYRYEGVYFELGDDIEYDGTTNNYTPIGNNYKHFCGHFDGKGHTISGINIDRYNKELMALFGNIARGAEIKNLTIDDTYIKGWAKCGGIVGQCASSTISNCHVTSTVTIDGYESWSDTHGGIAGSVRNDNGLVSGCTSSANVIKSGPSAYDGGKIDYGGIVGEMQYRSVIKDCLVYGGSINGYNHVGAVAGRVLNEVVLINNYHTLSGMGGLDGSDQEGARYAFFVTSSKPSFFGDVTATYGEGDYIGIKAYGTNGLEYNGQYYYNTMVLEDQSNNFTANDDLKGKPAKFTRSFTTGVASTICLPFPMTGIEGGNVYEFVGVEYDETDGWVATMTDATPDGNKVTTTEANKPYLFMPTSTDNVIFSGTIPSAADSYDAGTTTSGDWTFHGTYSRLAYGTDPFSDTVFGFAASTTAEDKEKGQDAVTAGEFVKAISGAYIPAFRAFLKYSGSDTYLQARGTRGGAGIPETITVRLIGKSGEIDGIGEIRLSTGEVTFDSNAWYDLNGRKLDGKPTVKGIYINGGHKVAIK